MKLIEQKIQILDVPNKNGRIYTTEVMRDLLDRTTSIAGGIGMTKEETMGLAKVSHICDDFKIKDGWLVANVKVLDAQKGRLLQELLNFGIVMDFRMNGSGHLQEDGTVFDYQLISVDAVLDGA